MKRLREKVRDRTGRNRAGIPIEQVIATLNPILRVGETTSEPGMPPPSSCQIDSYVVRRLRGLLAKKRGNLHAGVADHWTEDWFNDHGLDRLQDCALPEAA